MMELVLWLVSRGPNDRKNFGYQQKPFFKYRLEPETVADGRKAKVIDLGSARLTKEGLARVDALEAAIIAWLAEVSRSNKKPLFDLSGNEWYLQGKGLTLPQMKELRKRLAIWWTIEEHNDRLGRFLKFTKKEVTTRRS